MIIFLIKSNLVISKKYIYVINKKKLYKYFFIEIKKNYSV